MNTQKSNLDTAKLINTEQSQKRLYAELRSRPVSLAFIVREDINRGHFQELIGYLSTIWGGFYACLIPTDGEEISGYWWDILSRYNPDKIVVCGDAISEKSLISIKLLGKIEKNLQPYSYVVWNSWDNLNKVLDLHQNYSMDSFDNIPLSCILRYELSTLKLDTTNARTTKANISFPDISEDHPKYLNIALQTGVAKGFYKQAFTEIFNAEVVSFDKEDNISDYMGNLNELEKQNIPLDATKFYTTLKFEPFSTGMNDGLKIVVTGENQIRDYCLFWDLHLVFNIRPLSTKLLLFSIDELKDDENIFLLVNFLKRRAWNFNDITLFTDSVACNQIEDLILRLREALSEKNISSSKLENISNFRLSSTVIGDSTFLENQSYVFRAIRPPFIDFLKRGEWSVDVKFQVPFEYPMSSKLNYLLSGSPSEEMLRWRSGFWARYGEYVVVSYRINTATNFIKGNFISPIEAFRGILLDKGYEIKTNDRHSYTEGFLTLIESPKLLKEKQVRELFWHLAQENALSYKAMMNILRLGDQGNQVIDDLVTKKLLFRGIAFTCGFCGLNRWYPLSMVEETMQCPGCLRRVQPPTKLDIKFSLNELVRKSVNQGAISVILSKLFFDKVDINQKLFVYGVDIEKDDLHTDIDLLTTYKGELVLCECKEYKGGILQKEKRKAIKQLGDLVKIARDMDTKLLFLSSLIPDSDPGFLSLVRSISELKERNQDLEIYFLSLYKWGLVNLQKPDEILPKNIDLLYPKLL